MNKKKPDFCKRWCDVATQSSLNFMLLVIEEVKTQLLSVERELKTLENKLHAKTTDAEITRKDLEKIKEEVLSYTTKQSQVKRNKLAQVELDYKENRVYQWLGGGNWGSMRYPRGRCPSRFPRHTTHSSSSDSFWNLYVLLVVSSAGHRCTSYMDVSR